MLLFLNGIFNGVVITEMIDASLKVCSRTLTNWFGEDFPNTAICPHKSDYCPYCFDFHTSLNSLKQQIALLEVFICLHILF